MAPDPHDDRDDLEPTPEELREAAALASALEDGRAHADLPADAWQAAMLLRSDHPIPEPQADLALARRRRLRRSVWAGAVALAATVVLAIGVTRRGGADLPPPSAALLSAQASATSDGAQALDREMRTHRRAMLTELERHYRSDP